MGFLVPDCELTNERFEIAMKENGMLWLDDPRLNQGSVLCEMEPEFGSNVVPAMFEGRMNAEPTMHDIRPKLLALCLCNRMEVLVTPAQIRKGQVYCPECP